MVFGPIFGIIIVDYYLIANKQYDSRELDKVCGKYWFHGGFNWIALLIWFLGIVFFLVFRQLPFFANWIGATYPVMILTAGLYYMATRSSMRTITKKT